jgi:hypothetical protein
MGLNLSIYNIYHAVTEKQGEEIVLLCGKLPPIKIQFS